MNCSVSGFEENDVIGTKFVHEVSSWKIKRSDPAQLLVLVKTIKFVNEELISLAYIEFNQTNSTYLIVINFVSGPILVNIGLYGANYDLYQPN